MHLSDPLFSEDDLLPLSGLQHMAFCERQWALIHIEQQWEENPLTAEGRVLHEHVHEAGSESRKTAGVVRGLPLHSFRLGISGQADVVEFRHGIRRSGGVAVGRQERPVAAVAGRVQARQTEERDLRSGAIVCAGAVSRRDVRCRDPAGALFYATPRRRQEVAFTAELRGQTERLCAHMQELYGRRETPPPVYTRLRELLIEKHLSAAHAGLTARCAGLSGRRLKE